MDKDRRVSIETISAQFDVSVGTVYTIIREELKMPMICAKFVPKSSGRDSVGKGQLSSNRVSGISTRTMHQSTTPSFSKTIKPRWATRELLSLPIIQTLVPVTFGYSLSSEAVVVRQLKR